jgi:hypothetical protein
MKVKNWVTEESQMVSLRKKAGALIKRAGSLKKHLGHLSKPGQK